MTHVFLSYDHDDEDMAKALAAALEKAGHSLWWDRQIRGGLQFSKEIERALQDAAAIVVLWSERSVESAWVRDEAAVGRDRGRLVPVSIDGTLPPLGFRQFHTIALGAESGLARSDGFAKLVKAVEETAAGKGEIMAAPRLRRPVGPRIRARLSRRTLLIGAGGAASAGVGAFLLVPRREPARSPEVQALMAQAWQAWTQASREGTEQAIGLYRRATVMAPDDPDAWGLLGCVNGDLAQWAPAAERPSLRMRARQAGLKALSLDEKNAYGRMAVAYARPVRGNWSMMEREFRRAVSDQPDKWLGPYSLALLLTRVGRNLEAAALFETVRQVAPTVTQYMFHIQSLWSAGRLDDAEQLLAQATSIYGTHKAIWFTRLDMLLNDGKTEAALALLEDRQGRPADISDDNLRLPRLVAAAKLSRQPSDISNGLKEVRASATQSARAAETAIAHAALLGGRDIAFEIAEAFFFSGGFEIPDYRAGAGAVADITLDSRDTRFLFLPTAAALRADRRFERLVSRVGLESYWRSAKQPDYRTRA